MINLSTFEKAVSTMLRWALCRDIPARTVTVLTRSSTVLWITLHLQQQAVGGLIFISIPVNSDQIWKKS